MTNTAIEKADDDRIVEIQHRYTEMCSNLNIESSITEKAWDEFKRIHSNVTLEGNEMHWLTCALYISILKSSDKQIIKNIPLSKLLLSVKMSLLHFFQKARKWLDMARYGPNLNEKIEQLERNFSVSSIVFEKYSAIFKQVFKTDHIETIKKGRKKQTFTSKDIFNFCWILYVRTKVRYPDITDDLVNSYHLLLCCVDLVFSNVILIKQLKNCISSDFSGAPVNFQTEDLTFSDVPSIIDILCQLFEGLSMETKIIRRQYLGSYIEELLKNEDLKGNSKHNNGLLDINNIEYNLKYLNESYEEHISQVGDFDERIFVKEDSELHIGTPTKRVTTFTEVDERERSMVKRNLQEYFNKVKGFPPQTPLTGRQWLNSKETLSNNEASLSSITNSIAKIQELVKGLKPSPSENLLNILKSFKDNPEAKLLEEVNTLSGVFIEEYIKPTGIESQNTQHSKDFAKVRLLIASALFYRILEKFLENEKKKSATVDLSVLFENGIFVKSLLSCTLEIVIYSYNNSNRVFPWILGAFNLKPYHFFKIIELVIRSEDLSRDVIKHLSRIEEQILENLSWKTSSPIYGAIESHGVPRCQEVSSDMGLITPLFFMSPTTLRVGKDGIQGSPIISIPQKGVIPPPSPARRNLFGAAGIVTSPKTAGESSTNSTMVATSSSTITTPILIHSPIKQPTTAVVLPPKTPVGCASPLPSTVRFPIMLASPGSSPVRFFAVTKPPGGGGSHHAKTTTGTIRIQASPYKSAASKKYGSLGIFFRKLYHMTYVRLKDLCGKLEIGEELRKKIWTCFEHSLVANKEMLRDRHIDQLLMCAVYVMAKVTKEDKSFHDIMKWYRTQPQATSDVYRRVLIKKHSTKLKQQSEQQGGASNALVIKLEEEDTDAQATTCEDIEMKESDDVIKQEQEGGEQQRSNTVGENNRGGESEQDGEEDVYNDLIQFYNIIYIKKIKEFALRFASNKLTLDAPPLSPLPVTRKQTHSPKQVSKQHQIYISPIKPNLLSVQMTPRSKMLYCFDSDSPKKLDEINRMIKGGTRRRVNLDDPENGPSMAKRPMMNGLAKRAQELRNEQLNAAKIMISGKNFEIIKKFCKS